MNELKREWLEAIRTYKFIILAAGIVFYAILDPIMLKLLPKILEGQVSGIDISQLFAMSPKAAMQNYMKSLNQIGVLVTGFAFMRITAGELREGTLSIPVTAGLKPASWIGAKALLYGVTLPVFCIAGMLVNFSYASSLFTGESVAFVAAVKAGLWFGLYFDMLLEIEILMGCIARSPALCALMGMGVAWLLPSLTGLLGITGATPVFLLDDAHALTAGFSANPIPALLVCAALFAALYAGSVLAVRRADLGRRQTA